jgi:ribosomal protein S12 methylthiotransferase
MDSLVAEAEMLALRGVKELILVAQDTARYGTDIYGKSLLHELLRALSAVEGIEWIRILYCYPEHITEETILEMANNEKICRYLDMPMQHSNDKVLKLMNRSGSGDKLRAVIKRLRGAMPDIFLRTTVMTGFPGEGQEEYDDLLEFVGEMRFNNLGAFAFSKEEGTPASSMPGQVNSKTKNKRKNDLMKLQKGISREKREEYTGKIVTVIIDGYLPEQQVYCGRSQADCYEVDGMVFVHCGYQLNAGDFVQVLITAASEYDSYGLAWEVAYEEKEEV